MSLTDRILMLNAKYMENGCNGMGDAGMNFKIIEGQNSILLSAPHAVKQMRNGAIKQEDAITGGLTEYLCQSCQCHGIIRTWNAINEQMDDDPNFSMTGRGLEYKNAIVKMAEQRRIQLVIDIHGCSSRHGFDFCIGTNHGRNLCGRQDFANILAGALQQIDDSILVAVDEKFMASSKGTVSRYVSCETGVPCIQLEISSAYRKYRRNSGTFAESEKLQRMVRQLENVLRRFENMLTVGR